MEVELGRIFVFPDPTRKVSPRELHSLALHLPFIKEVAERLELVYDAQADGRGQVCYASAPELRSAYKTAFTKADLIRYIAANIGATCILESATLVPLPEQAADFWEGE
ncbi:hypothetical protein GGR28_003357 [Lewinella aquimaris]|uniref:Uncharacterized protein n=1 Tax=Neolewinella aquimaris TaxID=1835722 RepID=A0A840EAH4_9BACT|nr:hypothetical protein [Neolewinella aquimaris]MBB4080722.1 hypothetical protein [Neolewinella aquimaris]